MSSINGNSIKRETLRYPPGKPQHVAEKLRPPVQATAERNNGNHGVGTFMNPNIPSFPLTTVYERANARGGGVSWAGWVQPSWSSCRLMGSAIATMQFGSASAWGLARSP